MKQKLISLSLLLLVLSICIVVVDFFLEIPKKPQEPSVASPFLRFTNHYTGFPSAYLVVGGDIMLSRNIGYYNKRDGYDRIFGSGTYNPVSAFTGCHVENCLLFFNLESLFHPKDNDIQMGGFTFRANSANIAVLKQLRQPAPHQVNGRE
ncbi:MAG: hypothetical protein LBU27_00275 [Candidatus Peribacteria bacterium]|jgi:hypothetical protein|nr:hypothetical protein [Candidatus Peribacteria bacterium]